MRMARTIGGWLLVLAGSAAAQAAEGRFGWLGLAPAEAGNTLVQAEAALGAPLQPAGAAPKDAAGCHMRQAPSQPGVSYIVNQGVIARVETRDPRYATVRGLRVGDEVKRVKQVYGQRLSVRAHPYFDRGLILAVYSPDRKFALVMESNDAGRIVTLRGGLVPAVEYLEGCSA